MKKCNPRIETLETRTAPAFAAVIELSSLIGTNGFKVSGEAAGDYVGTTVSDAGDVNGDGFDDLIIGGYVGLGSPGRVDAFGGAYVVFGKASGFTANLNLSSLDGTNGSKVRGDAAGDAAGTSVSAAGDINGDGFGDLIIGAWGADSNGISGSGASYVVFGSPNRFTANLNLASLDGTTGFKLSGVAEGDQSGRFVSAAGDVNSDGFDDMIIGAAYADPNGSNSGASYVVFGKATGFGANVQLSALDGSNGFKLSGVAANEYSVACVSAADDVNGDGFDDVIIGARGARYVVFGKASGFAANLNLGTLDGSNGFKLSGAALADSGPGVSSAGDVNGDDIGDLIIGAVGDSPGGYQSGASYVVFGVSGFGANMNLSDLNGSNGFKINGVAALDLSGLSVSGAGDINGDGFDDVIVGAPWADPNGSDSGASYVIFGKASGFAPNLNLSTLNGSNGFKLGGVVGDNGVAGNFGGDQSGRSVSAAGDVNGDGFADVIIGARLADPNGVSSGASYIVFGAGNDDVPAVVSVGDGTALEGDSGTSSLVFTVSLSAASGLPATVRYSIADGTTVAGVDYIAVLPGTLTFAPGETTKTITVEVRGDTNTENHEQFSLVLSDAIGATIGNGTATGSILNDDTRVQIDDASVLEGHGGTRAVTFTVSLTAASALPVEVKFASVDGTASAGVDYTAPTPGTISFAPGETTKTITVDVLGDVTVESSETFSLTLSEGVNAAIDRATGLGTILDDDVALVGKRKATFNDVDGDIVKIKVSKGTLKVEDFTIVPSGQGAQLALVDLRDEAEFAGANLSITAKGAAGTPKGPRFVDVGYIDATGIDLGDVVIKGDLGQIDAGNEASQKPGLASLSAGSLGGAAFETQLSGGSLASDINGAVRIFTLTDGMQDAILSISGNLGAVVVGGDILGSGIHSEGRIGSVKIAGDVMATSSNVATLSALGVLTPTSMGKAMAIRSVNIGGSVDHALILAGYDRSGTAVNAAAGIGEIIVGSDWNASSLAAGASAGLDGFFGNEDDRLIADDNPIVARIASVIIKGAATGSGDGTGHYGFIAKEITAFKSAGTKLTLTSGSGNDLAGMPIGASGNLTAREIA